MRYARRRRGGGPPPAAASPVGFVTVSEDDGGRDDGAVFVAVNSASLWRHPFARAAAPRPGGGTFTWPPAREGARLLFGQLRPPLLSVVPLYVASALHCDTFRRTAAISTDYVSRLECEGSLAAIGQLLNFSADIRVRYEQRLCRKKAHVLHGITAGKLSLRSKIKMEAAVACHEWAKQKTLEQNYTGWKKREGS